MVQPHRHVPLHHRHLPPRLTATAERTLSAENLSLYRDKEWLRPRRMARRLSSPTEVKRPSSCPLMPRMSSITPELFTHLIESLSLMAFASFESATASCWGNGSPGGGPEYRSHDQRKRRDIEQEPRGGQGGEKKFAQRHLMCRLGSRHATNPLHSHCTARALNQPRDAAVG